MKLRKRGTLVVLAALAALVSLLAGCGNSEIRIGWVGSDTPGHVSATYRTFIGDKVERFQASAGQTIRIDYEVTVTKGSLAIRLEDPDNGTAWEVTLEADAADVVHVAAEKSGRYLLAIEGQDAGGGFDVRYSLDGGG